MAKPTPEQLATFEQDIADFRLIAPDDLPLLAQGSAVIFLGRPSCGYCRRFAPKLAAVAAQTGIKICFLDSRNKEALAGFRTQHQIISVPALLNIRDGQLTYACDSKLSENDILSFLTR